jgi:phosphate transport system protein
MTAQFVRLLDELQRRSLRMASLVEDILQEACEAALDGDARLAYRVITRDRDVDTEEVRIEAETVRLMALYQPVGCDLRVLCTVLKVNNDLERVADCAVNIAERARHLDHEGLGKQSEPIRQMSSIARRMLRSAIQAYGTRDADSGSKIFIEDNAVDAFYAKIIQGIVAEAAERPERMAAFLDALSIAKNLERIADHATNITEDVVFLATGEIVRHGGSE